ncbi:hypothetical protein ASC61_17290 [Aeromicrobium sp. Root344]|uniref:hypothetical protein n=1 Tax=Aeromicrobium sp. Root344 TaxID=1736521 RepID=UPI0006FB56ED|nr:hypothetical protein [Aeromicrobium sp. Root344]KQV76613.1 hypothetical protein ASC61_17290 [Aeromicrobium sp. Root344]
MNRSRSLLSALVVVLGIALAVTLYVRGDDATDAVFDSQASAVPSTIVPPQTATVVPSGMLVTAGDQHHVVPHAVGARWLPTGQVLLAVERKEPGYLAQVHRLYDPVRGTFSGSTITGQLDLPDDATTSISYIDGHRLLRWNLALTTRHVVTLPTKPRSKGSGEVVRSYAARPVTVDGATFVRFSEVENEEKTLSYGVMRIAADGSTSDVLKGDRITRLRVSADGRSLLAVQQHRGEPCGGCVVRQDVVEIDPADGKIVGTYGAPPGYSKQWRITRLDKVGGTVAVRYEGSCVTGDLACIPKQHGTWTYRDGAWSKVAGSERTETWWQGRDDRIVRRADRNVLKTPLEWLHDGRREGLDGFLADADNNTGDVAGGLLRPAS